MIDHRLEQNINQTIGIDYEIILINNSHNEYSIFSAYNLGIKKAKGDILCFMHEDILFHTNNWGEIVSSILEDSSIGMLGVFGSKLLVSNVSWWLSGYGVGEYIQGLNNKTGYCFKKEGCEIDEVCEDVALVDGFWFCMPRCCFDQIRFDDLFYSGFHCYDLDISMQTHNIGKRVVVTTRILIEHQSMGALNSVYYSQLELFSQKWRTSLPLFVGEQTGNIDFERFSHLLTKYHESEKKSNLLLQSHAFRIGSIIMRPIKFIKSLIK